MNKILGLDLGTNSIGWAIRNPNLQEIQIVNSGVIIFKKGVGEEKGNEFPLAAERTNKRGIRRNYQVKKYQKWQLIKTLINAEKPFCPLSKEDFELWYHYDKTTHTRAYPQTESFLNWLKLDFNNDGKAEFLNPYELRFEAIRKKLSNHEVGRALYHLVQRRGFLSNRKDAGDNEKNSVLIGAKDGTRPGANSLIAKIEKEGSLGAALLKLDTKFERIRNRYLLRSQVEHELKLICEVQGISFESDFYKNIHKAIIWQRPLRSQKGLVGKCTLEKNKMRCPISNPKFEIFRAWSVINNIKYKYKSEKSNDFRTISDEWKEKIWKEKFLKKKIDSFDFEEIIKLLDGEKIKQYDFNYKAHQNISASPVCAGLYDIFGDKWETLSIGKYDTEDIWHVLFNFEDEVKVLQFALEKLNLDPDKANKFIALWKKTPDGYAQLSVNALTKINEFLRLGLIYPEAVLYANMPKVLGKEFYEEHKSAIRDGVKYIFNNQNKINNTLKIANNLIGNFLTLSETERFGSDSAYKLDEDDKSAIEKAIVDFYGSKTWTDFNPNGKEEIIDKISSLYLKYLQLPLNNKGSHFYKIPRLDEAVIQFLKDNFDHITDKDLEHLYHPSDNDIYTPAPINKEDHKKYLQSPKTGSFKNPMAMRTLHELKKLINYMIACGKIDDDDRIVVEIARDLNDANMRKAIETWQNSNEKKNEEYKKEIERHGFNKNDKDLIQKVRLWNEQGKQSIYTGEMISITDVFDGIKFQIEHTIPRSLSFDDSLENKTLCETAFNAKKRNRIPTELDNYIDIDSRLKPWREKVDHYKYLVEINKKRSKSAQTKEAKDKAIQDKHFNKFELNYWRNKLYRFEITEIKGGFRNANLIDTQIITKYAFHYLKSVFKRVDIQKGEVTSIFRKIYEINEDKDRSRHTHHAIDAAILTLIPKVKEREIILKKYFEAQENRITFHQKPWKSFHQNQIMNLENETLINNSTRNKATVQTAKYVRRRGKIVYLTDKEGEFLFDENGFKIPKVAKGDTIRGQLHNESMLGAIKLPKIDPNGQPLRNENGQFVYPEKEPITYVIRKTLIYGDLGFTKREQLRNIIDPVVRQKVLDHIDKYGLNKETFKHPIWMNEEKGIRINKVRISTDVNTPLSIRKHIFSSSKEYKKYYYAETAKGANIICALYQHFWKGKIEREIEIVNLMDAAQLVSNDLLNEKGDISLSKLNKSGEKIEPYALLKQGTKVIFYQNNLDELKDLDKSTLIKRMYRVLKFTEGRITFEYNLEARSSNDISAKASELKDKNYFNGYSNVDINNPKPRLRLSKGNFNFALENKHFEVMPDGEIKWQ
jgi:CRISPR-associated endonuclease Csn1